MTEKPSILVVEDEAKMRRLLELELADQNFRAQTVADAETALKLLNTNQFDLIVTDLKLPGMSGMEFLQAVKRANAAIPIIIMTAFGTVESAVEAMKIGASDYVLKPFSLAELVLVIRKELDSHQLREENRNLREALGERYKYDNIVAQSTKMQAVLALVERVAPTNSTVLLGGESGVGKDLIARAIHQHSNRASGPFIKINSTAIPENLLESELFGYEKGAFSGATGSKPGKFELADKGTMFLDEIGDVPPAIQVKLLRVLQEREFERLGGTKTLKVDVRLDRRHKPRSSRRPRRRHISRRSLLPPERSRDRYSSAARPQRGHPRSRQFLPRKIRSRIRQAHSRHHARCDEDAARFPLAGQCSRTGKYHRARRHTFRRFHARRRGHSSRSAVALAPWPEPQRSFPLA